MPKQQKRRRNGGKRPRYQGDPSPKIHQTTGFSASNSPRTAASSSQARFSQQSQNQHSNSSHITGTSGHSQQSMAVGAQAPPGKVAIPALKNPRIAESTTGLKQERARHACDYCRIAKAACTGGNPCTRCLNANIRCVYGDGKRDKDKKRLVMFNRKSTSLSRHFNDVTNALHRIKLDIKLSSDDMRAAIDDVLHMAPTPVSSNDDDEPTFRANRQSSEAEEQGISDNEDLDMVGLTSSPDLTHTNTDRDDTRATGYMGKSSSVAWAKRTADETFTGGHAGLVLSSYYTEDADVEFFDTSNVNPFDWPDPKLADTLVESYFATTHKACPIVDKFNFMRRYNQFDRSSSIDLSTEDIIWLGTLNTIFAVSAVHAHLTRCRNRGHDWDHLVYVARAKMLCLDAGLLYEDANVPTASALGLLCLYFIVTCRLNRAWTVCGLAIRHALTLGLHVRNEATDLSDFDKENRVRLWWSLYSLECFLNELTGRPSCISDRDISTPLPMNINEDDIVPSQPLDGTPEDARHHSGRSRRRGSRGLNDLRPTYQIPVRIVQPLAYTFPVLTLLSTTSASFIYRTQLSIISHEIATQVYCAVPIEERWVEVQDTIKRIEDRLRAWRDNLPAEYTLTFDRWIEPDWSDPNVLPRLGLAILFNSSRMRLFQPCLYRFEGRMTTQSEKFMNFSQEGVQTCIHSARTMINLIGWTARNVERLYAITPWWHTLHSLCEALSILMLELAYQAQHLPGEAAYILDDAKRGIRWLILMSEQSISARKAWEIFDSLIRVVAPRINWSVYDLPNTAPVPPRYNWRRWTAEENSGFPSQQQMFQSNTLSQVPDLDSGLSPDPLTQVPSSSAPPWLAHTVEYQTPHAYPPAVYSQELVSNPLDQERALHMFGSIGAFHDHYDEPWHHMFGVSGPDVVSGIQRSGVVEPLPRSDAIAELGSGDAFVGNIDVGEFNTGYWAYVMNSRRDSALGGSVIMDSFL